MNQRGVMMTGAVVAALNGAVEVWLVTGVIAEARPPSNVDVDGLVMAPTMAQRSTNRYEPLTLPVTPPQTTSHAVLRTGAMRLQTHW